MLGIEDIKINKMNLHPSGAQVISEDKQASKHCKDKRQSWDLVQTPIFHQLSDAGLDWVLCLSELVSSSKKKNKGDDNGKAALRRLSLRSNENRIE